jgi:hypothetical protein
MVFTVADLEHQRKVLRVAIKKNNSYFIKRSKKNILYILRMIKKQKQT